MFRDLPDVLITINTSFLEPKASKFLEKILLNEKSFPHAVIVGMSVAKEIAGIGLLFLWI